ncbi:MAG: class I SAM-dependent methyltransferase [PVC group bacterium]
MKTQYVRCPLCDADQPHPVRQVKSLYSDDLFTVVKCRACGMLYINPWEDWTEKEARLKEWEDIPGFERAAAGETGTYRQVLGELERHCPPGRLLDVGCGTGGFLRLAREAGWEGEGVEINRSVGRYAAEKHGLRIFPGTLQEAAFPGDFFDAVMTINTLEHIHQPLPFMREAARVLKPEGYFYAMTPNYNNRLTRFIQKVGLRRQADPIDPTGHPCLFTAATLKKLLSRCGFSLVSLKSGITGEALFKGNLKAPVSRALSSAAARRLVFLLTEPFGGGSTLRAWAKKP